MAEEHMKTYAEGSTFTRRGEGLRERRPLSVEPFGSRGVQPPQPSGGPHASILDGAGGTEHRPWWPHCPEMCSR